MAYQFNFADVFQYTPVLAKGVLVTAELTAIGGLLGIAVGIAGAWALTQGPKWLRPPVRSYVELMRNTPFLIQLFFIFFGLPGAGDWLGERLALPQDALKLTEMQAALLAMVINLGAYSTEIIRAGIAAVPRGQIEAGLLLAMTRLQIFRHVLLRPALRDMWPALSSQLVIVMFGSAVCSQIAVEDLTFAANFIQSRNFRAFESYFVATAIYLLMALALRQLMRSAGSLLFARR